MQSYSFTLIEQKWQRKWEAESATPASVPPQNSPKYYILNMFPYPSGSGLHVGHYTGYVASDILSRYYRHNGYHIMNPMGFDSFGLPAEQYAVQTGQHPAITTTKNIKRYTAQLKQGALDFDWHNTINTSDPTYYKWTQWIFLQIFNSWYNTSTKKAITIDKLIEEFTRNGNGQVTAACDEDTPIFSAEEWHAFSETAQQAILLHYRMAYLKDSIVNWCASLGTVLSNEEVKNGVSERGNYPVTHKKMKQWSLRMTAYSEHLLRDLETLDWPLSTKEMQRNWIGRSKGAEITFRIQGKQHEAITVFTTRPETIFGTCFIALAPEHPFVALMADQIGDAELIAYIEQAKNRSNRSRLAETTFLSGAFLGSCGIHPFTGAPLPIWVADYVLPNYGTAAIMGVPAHNKLDYLFAQSFDLLILPVIESNIPIEDGPYEATQGKIINSDFLNGLSIAEATEKIIQQLTQKKLGKYKVHYRLQDPIFSRQRYWGEPLPIYYKENGLPYALSEAQLPLMLPEVNSYQPNKSGAPPLSNASNWVTPEGYPLELTTMPGWAGSSWYFLRYMDAHNPKAFIDKAKVAYWHGVDFYIGGSEHATGHLLYARFWTKLLHDLGFIHMNEPFQKLFHQGIIQNLSAFVYRIKGSNTFISCSLQKQYDVIPMHIPIEFVQNNILDIEAFKKWRPELSNALFILEKDQYVCGRKLEKMSKSKHNIVTPDTVIAQYGADVLRLYLMFLGPLEQTKPWSLDGIEGIARFLNKVWRFVHHAKDSWNNTSQPSPTNKMLTVIHKSIKKVTEDIKKCSFNTAISSLMICLNSLSTFTQSVDQSIIEKFLLLLEPFAPHISAELWENIGKKSNIKTVAFPLWDPIHLMETKIQYPISVNGKMRTKLFFDCNTPHTVIEQEVLANEVIQKWLRDKAATRVVIIPNKIVNIIT